MTTTISNELTRRKFLQTSGAGILLTAEAVSSPLFSKEPLPGGNGLQWYRGNLHMHTLRSDGGAFPEEAAALYKRLGYHYVALTEHNSTHENPNLWLKMGQKKLSPALTERFQKTFDFPLDRKIIDGTDAIRLRTFHEMEQLLNEPNRFLMISGNEVSSGSKNGEELHCGFINTKSGCKTVPTQSAAENLQWNLALSEKLLGGPQNTETLFIVNHPLWRFYDIDPQLLIENKNIRFFEVANVEARPLFPSNSDFWSHDKFWDIVNSFRAEKHYLPLYGIGSDDTHNYDMFYQKNQFVGYVMVRAPRLTTHDIIGAMHRGDFYTSNGLELDELDLNRKDHSIHLKVKKVPGFQYKIEFIGTKKNFDHSIQKEFDYTASGKIPDWAVKQKYKLPTRHIKRYSDEIGTVLKTVDGSEGSYQLQNDDLYVRARIITQKGTQPEWEHPTFPIAWTQPIFHFE